MSERRLAIGDVFRVSIDDSSVKFFQYIARDSLQLGSHVIRAFVSKYGVTSIPPCSQIVSDEVEFFAHCFLRIGIRHGYWTFTCLSQYKETVPALFRDTNDYGRQIETSRNWHVWRVGDRGFRHVGRLSGANINSEIGVVVPPDSIVHRMRTGTYDFIYPGYQ